MFVSEATKKRAQEKLKELQERLEGYSDHNGIREIAHELIGLGTTLRMEAEYADPFRKPLPAAVPAPALPALPAPFVT